MPLVLISLILLVLSAGCSGPYSSPASAAREDPALPVEVYKTSRESIPEVIAATGELLAEEQATIGSRVPGRVTRLHVDLGSRVSQGQVLAEIEKDDYEFRVNQSDALVNQSRARLGILDHSNDDVKPEETALVRRADADLKEANFVFETTQQLAKDGVLSRIDYERANVRRQGAEAAYQSALEEVMQLRAQLTERRAELALARQNLADCVIRAPFDGAITRRIASLGEYLPVNAPIVELVRQHPLRLRLEVPERDAAKVRIGQSINVLLEGGASEHTGRVVRLSPSIAAANRSLVIEGEIPNEQGVLRPGTFAEAVITVNADAAGISIPRGAMLSFAGIERVYLVSGGQLEDRVIKTGRRLSGDRIEVVEGLEPGMQVVREANDRMTTGQKVAVR